MCDNLSMSNSVQIRKKLSLTRFEPMIPLQAQSQTELWNKNRRPYATVKRLLSA